MIGGNASQVDPGQYALQQYVRIPVSAGASTESNHAGSWRYIWCGNQL